MKIVNKNTDKLGSRYTDTLWQGDFARIKRHVKPSDSNKMKVISDKCNRTNYCGKTLYQYYCDFINDILKNIRRGKTDYCFFVYQVAELLKYEHEDLQAEWLPEYECFKLSLKTIQSNTKT